MSPRNLHLNASQARALQVLAPLRLMTYEQAALASGIAYKTAAKPFKPLVCRELIQVSQVYKTQDIGFGKAVTPTVVCALTKKGETFCRNHGYLEDDDAAFIPSWTTGARLYAEDESERTQVKTLNAKDIFHTLGIVTCQAAIMRSLALNPSRALVRMLPDFKKIGIGKSRKKLTADKLRDGRRIEPDSITVIENVETGNRATLFLEYQHRNRSTEKFGGKLESYRDYFRFQGRKFNEGVPLLLFVVSIQSRVESMARIETAWTRLPDEFRASVRFAWEEDIKADFLCAPWVDGFGKPSPIMEKNGAVH